MTSSQKGFTLMEVMITIVVLSILMIALIPTANVYLVRARDSSRIQDLTNIHRALRDYEQTYGKFPLAQGGVDRPAVGFEFSLVPEVSALGFSGGGGPCPMIGIVCGPGFDPYQNPFTCAESCIPSGAEIWARTDYQCMSYLSDVKFAEILPRIPRDPTRKNPFPCLDSGNVGSYGFATGADADGNGHMILTAELENPTQANVGKDEIDDALVNDDLPSLSGKQRGSYVDIPGDTPYYVIYD